jgi:hypothetical protein
MKKSKHTTKIVVSDFRGLSTHTIHNLLHTSEVNRLLAPLLLHTSAHGSLGSRSSTNANSVRRSDKASSLDGWLSQLLDRGAQSPRGCS